MVDLDRVVGSSEDVGAEVLAAGGDTKILEVGLDGVGDAAKDLHDRVAVHSSALVNKGSDTAHTQERSRRRGRHRACTLR